MSVATDSQPNNFTGNLLSHLSDKSTYSEPQGPKENPIFDNTPWIAANEYGRNSKGSYYYLNEPSMYQLYKTARYTAFGWRLVYDVSADIWNNNFKLKFESLADDKAAEKNKLLIDHLHDIMFFKEAMKATAFDREQGEALLYVHREGDIDAELFKPVVTSQKILRCEAINKMDYTIPQIGKFGAANQYNISFYRMGQGKPMYVAHPSRAVRIRLNNLEYDQYVGNGILKPIFGDIQIILMLTRAVGDAAFRWAHGIPTIITKGVNDGNRASVKNAIGDPTAQSWLMLPSEHVVSFDFKGAAGTMLDIHNLSMVPINNIIVATGIPKPILLGEVAGVQTGSEVNERSYFAVLDQNQQGLAVFVREFLMSDPEAMAIIGDDEYSVDWGLREVMTVQAKAALRQSEIANGVALAAIGTHNECRLEAKLPIFEKTMDATLCMDLYGYTPEQCGNMPMTTFQAMAITVFNALSEEEEEEEEEEVESPEKPDNDPKPPSENKMKQPEKPVKDKSIDIDELSRTKLILRDSLANFKTVVGSVNKLIPELGISKGSIYKLCNALHV